MTEYIVKIRVNDSEDTNTESIKTEIQELLDEVNGHAPYWMTVDSIESTDEVDANKIVEKAILNGTCPNCKKDELDETERLYEYVSFFCNDCSHEFIFGRDWKGLSYIEEMWIDENDEEAEEFGDEKERVLWERDK